jgi:hypothetical protein
MQASPVIRRLSEERALLMSAIAGLKNLLRSRQNDTWREMMAALRNEAQELDRCAAAIAKLRARGRRGRTPKSIR